MEKYRQMGLSEDEAKIHLKREKRAEKVEKERRLQIEAEAGFQIAIKNIDFGVGSKAADFGPKVFGDWAKVADTNRLVWLDYRPLLTLSKSDCKRQYENFWRINEKLKFFQKS